MKIDNKGMGGSAAASPLSPGNSMLGPRAQMVMSGSQTIPMVNVGAASHSNVMNHSQQRAGSAATMPFPSQQQHHQQSVQNMSSLSRSNQHVVNNIRGFFH